MAKEKPLPLTMNVRLSVMMFLQYAIWGAWLPLFYLFLTQHRGLEGSEAGTLIAWGAVGALAAPFIGGQIADRWFNTERFLAISHICGAYLVWQLASATDYSTLRFYSLLYGLVYAPTLSLTNSLAFHHLPDRDRDFSKVRVWGTIGWIAVGIGFAQWLRIQYSSSEVLGGMADSLRLSGILGAVMGIFCLTLPKTPPQQGVQKFAVLEAAGTVLRKPLRNPLFWLYIIGFMIACVHQFYFVQTAPFLGSLELPDTATINTIFGVGGGGLMTIGQIAEILVLASIPFIAKRISRKTFLTLGLLAYILRFAVFAYLPETWAVIPALSLHGFCFGFFFFIAFLIVDEETAGDAKASAQSLFQLIVVGVGIIVGSIFAGEIGARASVDGVVNYQYLFSVPMFVTIGCLALHLIFYPESKSPR